MKLMKAASQSPFIVNTFPLSTQLTLSFRQLKYLEYLPNIVELEAGPRARGEFPRAYPETMKMCSGSEMVKWEDLGKGWTWQCEIRG
jgi:hypothetical protein